MYKYCKDEAEEVSIVEYSQNVANKTKTQVCPVNLINGFMECHHHFFEQKLFYPNINVWSKPTQFTQLFILQWTLWLTLNK